MGTRNLTAVVVGGKYVVAQYGQWDGQPDGQGTVALAFCREHLTRAAGREAFKAKLARVSFFGKGVTDAEAEPFRDYWTRDNGAKILGLIAAAKGDVKLTNSIDFAGDSLSCEWAYVIDLDQLTFEVFEGFNKVPFRRGEIKAQRFAKTKCAVTGYYPVRHVATFKLRSLPTEEKFLDHFKDDENLDGDEVTP